VSIGWKRDGEPVPVSGDQLKIAAGVARHDETWTCTAVASDGELSSAPAEAKVTVHNSAPGAPKAVVEPESPRRGRTCPAASRKPAEEPDGDPVSYSFVWRSGASPSPGTPPSPGAPASATKRGSPHQCEVTASDGRLKGPAVTAEARYRNSAPSSPAVRLAPASPIAGPSSPARSPPPRWTRTGTRGLPIPVAEERRGSALRRLLAQVPGRWSRPATSGAAWSRRATATTREPLAPATRW
jgi:hypothetical protein